MTSTEAAKHLMEEGRLAYRHQRFTDAIVNWSQATELLASQNNSVEHALALSYLTAAYQQLGQWVAANDSLRKSLALLSDEPTSPAEYELEAQVHNTQGSFQFAQGQAQAALNSWQHAASLYTQNGDEPRYLNNLLNQVQAQQTLGYYRQARNTLATLEARLPMQEPSLQIQGYKRLGQAYRLIGELETSQKQLQTALTIEKKQSGDIGSILLELGNTRQAQGEFSEAIALYQQVLEQTEQTDTRVKARLNQLKLWVETDPSVAQQIMSRVSTDIARMPQGRSQIYAYVNAAQSLNKVGTPTALETSAHLLVKAIHLSVSLQDSRAEAYSKGYLGHVYEMTQQWRDAQALTEEALTLAITINATDIGYQWQWQLGRLLKQKNQQDLALSAYREALSMLQSLRQDLVEIQPDLQFSFQDSIQPLYREFIDLLLQPDRMTGTGGTYTDAREFKRSKEGNAEQQQSRLQETREVLESLQIAELDNFFRTACLEDQQVALEDIEQTDAAIIYPIILPNRLELLVSLPQQPLQQYTINVSQEILEKTLVDWRQNLEKPFTTPEGKALGQELYDWIIQPLQSALTDADVTTLTFVLDGAFRNAPIAALNDGEQYLVEQYAVALAPGLQLLGPRPFNETTPSVLLAGLTKARHGFGELVNVEHELTTVANLVKHQLLLDEAFTTDNLAQQVSQSNKPIVHLATHGQFSSKVEDTFILAWDRPIPVHELSELLKVGDLNRLEPIELLLLSACETATGDSRAALGLAGVALQSGTRTTLASLWNLDDASGAALSEQFYQALTQPETTKAKALQQAQLSLLKDPNYRHPTYWAAYILVGNWL